MMFDSFLNVDNVDEICNAINMITLNIESYSGNTVFSRDITREDFNRNGIDVEPETGKVGKNSVQYDVENHFTINYIKVMERFRSLSQLNTNKKKITRKPLSVLYSSNTNTKEKRKIINDVVFECSFCKNNEPLNPHYKTHSTYDLDGKVECPKLRAYKCKICGVSGDNAHTRRYCPQKKIITLDDTIRTEQRKNFRI